MQDDKPPVFEAAGLLELSIAAMTGMVSESTFVPDRMRQAAEQGYATATDLADWLVREADVPFREAHHITGAAVKLAEENGLALNALPLAELQAIDMRIDARVFDAMSVEASVASRASYGGTAPECVRMQVCKAADKLGIETLTGWRRAAYIAVLMFGVAGCGQKTQLEPQAGQILPPNAYGSSVESDAEKLLEVPPQAVPERSIELRRRSEPREDDPFELPPE